MAGFWLLMSVLVIIVVTSGIRRTTCTSESDALYALRRSLHDPENVLQSWDPTLVTPCTWFHITCNRQNRVTRLDLGNAKLSGSLVPELGNLQYLQYLELYKNHITGTIPEELGKLENLVSLDLYMNNLTGSIPSSLGSLKSLVFIRLNDNQLGGQIPRELTRLERLKVVDLSNNNLCGTIPTSGSFAKFSAKNFENNSRLDGPELQGFVAYQTTCT